MHTDRSSAALNRREFLKGLGVSVCLPYMPSLFPWSSATEAAPPPKRLLFMAVPLGFIPNQSLISQDKVYQPFSADFKGRATGWFPETNGAQYPMPEVHAKLEPFRSHISFLKGLNNRKYRDNVHQADTVFLTGADNLANTGRGNTVSCDQVAAECATLGGREVRYPSLCLGNNGGYGCSASQGLSWSQDGLPIVPLRSPAQVFDRLFGNDDLPKAMRVDRLKDRRSVLDATLQSEKAMRARLNADDRTKLDEVLSAIEQVEQDIQREELWMDTPKPAATCARPGQDSDDTSSVRHVQAMHDLIHAAFITDSTRVITYYLPESFKEVTPHRKHELTHPSGDPTKIQGAIDLDHAMTEQLARLLGMLCDTKERDGQPLIYHALGAFGSGSWGTTHALHNLPMLLFGHGGGAIRQGVTRSFQDPTPLSNLWLTMLRACGVKADSFSDSTGELDGLRA